MTTVESRSGGGLPEKGMVTLRIRPGRGRWHASLHGCDVSNSQLRDTLAGAIAKGRSILLDWFRNATDVTDAIRLEVAKSAITDGEISLGLAHRLAELCRSDPGEAHEVSGPGVALALPRILPALAYHGILVEGEQALRRRDQACNLVAIAAGATAWWATVFRTMFEPSRLPVDGKLLFAVHGETSTRTRHLLRIAGVQPGPRAIVLLGRPKASLRTLGRQWKAQFGPLPPLCRPWDLVSALRSMGPAMQEVRRLMRSVGSSPWRAPFRERSAMAFRVFAGFASDTWWSGQRSGASLVAFGHTGLADTHLLEMAMHSSGVRTVHAAHGLSGGLNFIAFSSMGIFRCGADAGWHESEGTYGESSYVPAKPSPVLPGGAGALLVTSLAHPMNLEYRLWGIRPELDLVKQLASELDERSPGLSWRPHPSLWSLPAPERDHLLRAAEGLGVGLVRGADSAGYGVDQYRVVYCTPSTMVLDLAMAGRTPVVVGDVRFAGQLAFSPQPAAEARDVQVDEPGSAGNCPLWSRVQPGEQIGIEYLLELAQS